MLWLKNLPPYRRFQSTPPARGATVFVNLGNITTTFQSTPPARGATFDDRRRQPSAQQISIHAPREGGD